MSRIGQGWAAWQPTKAMLVWSCLGSVVATMVVGFTWGNWSTGGSAREMAADAATASRQELAAAICTERFMASPDAGAQLTALHELSSYRQSSFIREGTWAVMPDGGSPDYQVASQCAATLATHEVPASTAAAVSPTTVN